MGLGPARPSHRRDWIRTVAAREPPGAARPGSRPRRRTAAGGVIGEVAVEDRPESVAGPDSVSRSSATSLERRPVSADESIGRDVGDGRLAGPAVGEAAEAAGLDQDEVGVFQGRRDRAEARRRVSVRLVDPDAVAAFDQVGLRDAALRVGEQPIVGLGRDRPLVDRPLDRSSGQRRASCRRSVARRGSRRTGGRGRPRPRRCEWTGGRSDPGPAPRAADRTAGVPRDRARRSAR